MPNRLNFGWVRVFIAEKNILVYSKRKSKKDQD